MAKWARIEGDRVAEITDTDPQGRFVEALVWIECPADVAPGWRLRRQGVRPAAGSGSRPRALRARGRGACRGRSASARLRRRGELRELLNFNNPRMARGGSSVHRLAGSGMGRGLRTAR